jgi:hypothetical protein
VNAQELFLDVSSGRFLDGESTIPTIKPSFFSDEQKRVNISVLKVKNNKLSSVTPSPDSKFKFRLGTATLKLADATSVTSTPPTLFTAVGTVSTLSALQAKGQSTIVTYSPTTATLEAIVVTFPVVTGTFQAKIDYTAPVTATVTALISTVTLPRQEIPIYPNFVFNLVDGVGNSQPPIYFSAVLNTPVTATFLATITGGSVTTISILNNGLGYPNGEYALTFAGGSPSTTASAVAVASGGEIQSISISNAGAGYSSTPSVTLFLPAKSIQRIIPSNYNYTVNNSNQQVFFYNALPPVTAGTVVTFSFSSPDNTSTPTKTSIPQASLTYTSGTGWSSIVNQSGYGYTNAPTVSHNPFALREFTSKTSFDKTFLYNTSVSYSGEYKSFEQGSIRMDASYVPYRSLTNKTKLSSQTSVLFRAVAEPINFYLQAGSSQNLGLDYLNFNGAKFTIRNGVKEQKLGGSLGNSYSFTELGLQAVQRKLKWTPILQNSLAENSVFYAIITDDSGISPTRHALLKVEFPKIRKDYVVRQEGFADYATASSVQGAISATDSDGGGVFEPTITVLDYGAGYSQNATKYKVEYVSNLSSGIVASSQLNRNYSIATPPNTILSQTATVTTSFSGKSINIIIQNGGFGYIIGKPTSLIYAQTTVSGGVVSASISNIPQNYLDGEYSCSVASSPSGNTARVNLIVSGKNITPYIVDSGFGYTTAPTITAPEPNAQTGRLSSIVIVTAPQGYSSDRQNLIIGESAVSFGTAAAYFYKDNQNTIVVIENPGYGYQTAPTITAPVPDLAYKNGYISSINLTNQPKGYIVGQEYDLQIQNSPTVSGSAVARMIRSDETRFDVSIINSGYGYTSAPLITAPAPDASQGVLNIVSVATLGRGYAPGTYNCTVDKAPGGESTAIVNFISESPKVGRFEVVDAGRGYVVAPAVVVPTPAGNVLNQITISCQGNYYINSTANFVISDGSGQGQETGSSILDSGKILGVNVLNGGYGFTNNPTIVFTPPTAPVVATIPEYVIQGDLNITTASANAILSTATQRDILMEVYETDGTNEQVVAQATVSLAKRVLE